METTCHRGSTGLSLLPWPCPGHINPSDRIARTCPSFWVSIYTTWQSGWPSLTRGSKKKKKKIEMKVPLARRVVGMKPNNVAYPNASYLNWKKVKVIEAVMSLMFVHGLIYNRRPTRLKRTSRRRKKLKGVWWPRTLTRKVLECWPLRLTSPNMFPQAIP